MSRECRSGRSQYLAALSLIEHPPTTTDAQGNNESAILLENLVGTELEIPEGVDEEVNLFIANAHKKASVAAVGFHPNDEEAGFGILKGRGTGSGLAQAVTGTTLGGEEGRSEGHGTIGGVAGMDLKFRVDVGIGAVSGKTKEDVDVVGKGLRRPFLDDDAVDMESEGRLEELKGLDGDAVDEGDVFRTLRKGVAEFRKVVALGKGIVLDPGIGWYAPTSDEPEDLTGLPRSGETV